MSGQPPKRFDSNRHFNAKRAAVYDGLIRQVIPGYDALHAMTRVLLLAEVGAEAHLLVAGTGTGAEMLLYGQECSGWRFTGVDPSADMMAVAERRVAELAMADRVDLVTGYVDDLADEARFDAATCMLVMHFLPDDEAAPHGGKAGLLAAIARRLKPGAPLVLADLHAEVGGARFRRLLDVWRHWQVVHGIPEAEVEKGFRHVIEDISFVPEQRIIELLHAAGFATVEPFFGAYLFGGWIAWRGRD